MHWDGYTTRYKLAMQSANFLCETHMQNIFEKLEKKSKPLATISKKSKPLATISPSSDKFHEMELHFPSLRWIFGVHSENFHLSICSQSMVVILIRLSWTRNQPVQNLEPTQFPKEASLAAQQRKHNVCPSRANSVVYKQVRFLRHRAPIPRPV